MKAIKIEWTMVTIITRMRTKELEENELQERSYLVDPLTKTK